MELESLSCNNCGAPLQVPESANFVRCNHCQTQLAIRRTESTTFTEQLGELTKQTSEIKQMVTELARQNRVAAIDRHWEHEKKSYMVRGKRGTYLPTEAGSLIGGLFIVVFGIFWTVIAGSIAAASRFWPATIFPLFGVVFVIFGLVATIRSHTKARDYRAAERRYRSERTAAFEDKDAASPEQYLREMRDMPTPEDYLRRLGN